MTCLIRWYVSASYTRAEIEGVPWLCRQLEATDVSVTRRSAREFDLRLAGLGRPIPKHEITPTGPQTFLVGKRVPGEFCINRFTAWFPLACLSEFWGMGLIEVPMNEWSFIRDADPDENWRLFHRVLARQRAKLERTNT